MTRFKLITITAFATFAAFAVNADDFTMNYSATVNAVGGPGDFAPYYLTALQSGKVTSGREGALGIAAWRPIDTGKRFSYSFGVEAWARATNSTDYSRFLVNNPSGEQWHDRSSHPARVWLQQLWGEVKYRGVYLWLGMRDFTPALVNPSLSSGDLIESGNARPIPGGRAGFIDFQNIPFTNGWVQIQGEIGFAKSTDNDWQKQRYNYYNSHLNLGWWYNYKRCFFRTKPSMPFSITIGMQAAAQFAGETTWYGQGYITRFEDNKFKVRDLLDMIILRQGDEYWKGNHVGSWDFQARYRFRDNNELKAYFQWLWEDGSGIGKLNGMDGLWGIEWSNADRRAPVSGAVFEVLTFMNQGGPIHYDYDDHPGTDLNAKRAEGADNYYNNTWFNGYAIYGMGIGSPMFPSPILNTDGTTTQYVDNRFWGIHAALEGNITPMLSYRAMASYRRFYGSLYIPALNTSHTVSAMAQVNWQLPQVPGLQISARLAFDTGNSIYGDNFGAMISATYCGIFNFKSRKSKPCAL